MRLRRADGQVYLERWGLEWKHLGGLFVHRMSAPDPGIDLHNHPWHFSSLVLWGAYEEERCDSLFASSFARFNWPSERRGERSTRRWLSWRSLNLNECHRIVKLHRPHVWTLVVHGPWRRNWGFYMPEGYVESTHYSRSRRDMWEEAA